VWDKNLRYCIFTAVYQKLFWEDESVEYFLDWSFIIENIPNKDTRPEIDLLDELYEVFLENKANYTEQLQNHLKNWNRTFPDVRACLFTFLLEKDSLKKKSEDVSDIVSKYVRLSEDLIGGKNVGLVHAIVSKLTNTTD